MNEMKEKYRLIFQMGRIPFALEYGNELPYRKYDDVDEVVLYSNSETELLYNRRVMSIEEFYKKIKKYEYNKNFDELLDG